MQLAGTTTPRRFDQGVRVLLSRAAQLSGGYALDVADPALANDIDLPVATSLLARGWPPSTAVRILR
jgi:hypothetical protein